MRRQRHAAERDRVLILSRRSTFTASKLGVRVVAETKVADAAVLEQHGVGLGHHHLRARQALQLRETRDVIAVSMRREQDLDVVEVEAELLDALLDLAAPSRRNRVDQDVAGVGRDQVRRQVVGPDPVDVADQLERRERPRPIGVLLRRRGGAEAQRQDQRTHDHGVLPLQTYSDGNRWPSKERPKPTAGSGLDGKSPRGSRTSMEGFSCFASG